MQKRLVYFLILILLVLLPLVILGWQGWRLIENDREIQQARDRELTEARLQRVDLTIQHYLESLAHDWRQRLVQWQTEPSRLRDYLANEYRVRHIFVIGADNKRKFPQDRLSSKEQAFINQLDAIWNDPSLLKHHRYDEVASEDNSSFGNKVHLQMDHQPESGWYMWHWGAGTRLIFWQKNNQQEIIGLALETVRLKADLIGLLPESLDARFHIRLKDATNQEIYQWGGYQEKTEKDYIEYRLSYPLSSWTLEYAGDTNQITDRGNYGLFMFFAALALVLVGMAVYLYREQVRELAQAAQKVAFVGQVSHEFKTPLTNIRLYAEMLEDQLESDTQQRNYLSVIINESQRLSRLIANVLNFSREPQLHRQRVALDALVRKTLENFQLNYETRKIKVRTDLQADIELMTDPDQLEQVLNNLLSNVEKYATAGKAVDLSSYLENQKVIITVRDYGPGIPQSERHKIFKPFYRINDSLTEGVSGTGIGLTIARAQARRLGGDLKLLESTSGACFVLELPMSHDS